MNHEDIDIILACNALCLVLNGGFKPTPYPDNAIRKNIKECFVIVESGVAGFTRFGLTTPEQAQEVINEYVCTRMGRAGYEATYTTKGVAQLRKEYENDPKTRSNR